VKEGEQEQDKGKNDFLKARGCEKEAPEERAQKHFPALFMFLLRWLVAQSSPCRGGKAWK
jgi:hypothetical protein